jgi:hypothetical protein
VLTISLLALLAASCSGVAGQEAELGVGPSAVVTTSTTTTNSTTTTTTTVPPAVARAVQEAADTPAPGPAPTPSPSPRTVHQQAWIPFASAGGVTLSHPSSRVELIGFHESNLDGARELEPLAGAAPTVTLEARGRDTGSRTAADVVVDPATEIRSPVTGTVRYAGSYILYCNHTDNFLVIEPDDHPGWEVKVLHVEGLLVGVGARVTAGRTPISPNARTLPFQSQVDKVTAQPPWPHVHVEIDDPNIPDRPTPGGGC